MMAGRIDAFYAARAPAMGIAPDGIESEFGRLHYDTANATHPAAMAALLRSPSAAIIPIFRSIKSRACGSSGCCPVRYRQSKAKTRCG
jgi:hypothetical protein